MSAEVAAGFAAAWVAAMTPATWGAAIRALLANTPIRASMGTPTRTRYARTSFRFLICSPNPASLLPNHRLTQLTRERRRELRHIGNHAIDAVFFRRVRISNRVHPLALHSLIAAGPLRHADEEPLIGSEAIDGVQILVLGRVLPGHVGQDGATQVRHVFAQSQLAVNLDLVYDGV